MTSKPSAPAKAEMLGWEAALNSFLTGFGLGSDGIGLFALQLQFDVDDIATVAAEALTGGGDDKKCDMLWLDTDRGMVVIAQCYMRAPRKIRFPDAVAMRFSGSSA